ncbi:MAG: Propionyl-CoA carboxylase beta chain [Alphaproteobacteria bacterium MarineAlpha9_Bin4]|nr:MAG: Propionyl-CoA carboxylase beta chain [Alphaproteobacteria bacterium MarineAlpha9_Bin4]|tara:strand:+ start:2845 stop:4371 length:1527 start_codon:yes stop_codon:yes gene_type:complete
MTEINKKLTNLLSKAQKGGGNQRVIAQYKKGKLTARERINILLDDNSFEEIGMLVKSKRVEVGNIDKNIYGDGVVTGYGTINGNNVMVYSQDFTVYGGSLGEEHANKICRIMDMAIKNGMPIIGLNDSGGARIQEGVSSLGGYAEVFQRNVLASGVIPQISAILGPCAGGAVYSPAITDFIFMSDRSSYMFVTGPEVVKTVTHEEVNSEYLGGASTHAKKSGVADFVFDNEIIVLQQIRRLIDFLPNSNQSKFKIKKSDVVFNKTIPSLNSLVPRDKSKPYDMRDLVLKLADSEDFFEVQKDYASNIIIGFLRIDGYTVGLVGNQPIKLAGCLDINSSRKAARFVRFCDCFNIPILTLVDVPGFLPGTDQEFNGIIKHGAKLLFAYAEATVPKVTVITRKAYGGAYDVMSSKHLRGDINYAWPTAEIAVMGAEGAAKIIFKKVKENHLKDKIDNYEKNFSNPYVAASRGYIDEVILPSKTRLKVSNAFRVLREKKLKNPWKKHDNIPL